VLVAGELNPDLILRNYSQFPEPGKEVVVEDLDLTMGSSSAICAMGLARLGDAVTFAGTVGCDAYGSFCIETLQRAGIDISCVAQRPDLKTGITVSITSSKDRALVTYLGAIATLRPRICRTKFSPARIISTSLPITCRKRSVPGSKSGLRPRIGLA
jgi:sugar/nucleoside kinase (ribokinase family)